MAYDPELMDALLGIIQGQNGPITVSAQSDAIKDALERARMLKDAPEPRHHSALGGLIGAISQTGGAMLGRGQEQKALDAKSALDSQNANLMRQAGPALFPGATQDLTDEDIAQMLSQYGEQQGM